MIGSKRRLGSDLPKIDATTDENIARQIAEDPDTAPELTGEFSERADFYVSDKLTRRGRPAPGSPTKPGLFYLRGKST